MTSKNKFPLIRNIEASYLFELFLLNSVFSIIVIRVFLFVTGYPKLGGGGFHIAHMLWGGLLMTVAILMQTVYLDKKSSVLAAILGGLGFGTFIDELGKFVTSDNNYFFKPTFAFIYVIFIILFFMFRWFIKSKELSKDEYLGNFFEILQDSITEGLDQERLKKLRSYLENAKLPKNVGSSLRRVIPKVTVNISKKKNVYSKTKSFFLNHFNIIIHKKRFPLYFAGFFVIWGISSIFSTLSFFVETAIAWNEFISIGEVDQFIKLIEEFNFFDWGSVVVSIVINIFIIIGIFRYSKSRQTGLQWFQKAVLMSLLLGQFFSFYHNQLMAFFGVALNTLLYYSLNFLASKE